MRKGRRMGKGENCCLFKLFKELYKQKFILKQDSNAFPSSPGGLRTKKTPVPFRLHPPYGPVSISITTQHAHTRTVFLDIFRLEPLAIRFGFSLNNNFSIKSSTFHNRQWTATIFHSRRHSSCAQRLRNTHTHLHYAI